MTSELELKKELIQLLAKDDKNQGDISFRDDIDYERLLELSSQISSHDTKNVRFSVDAKLVDRLGQQLVAKKTTALSELIKNAYDADASKVKVDFVNTDQPKGKIIIYDDGNGMNYQELVNGFMRISTADKISTPLSPRYKRARAGRKGIGRFSAQKIGSKLTLITKRNVDSQYLVVDIDWDKFDSGSSLVAISNKVTYLDEGYDFKSGTVLEIQEVREAWSEGNIKTSFNYISKIINVAPGSENEAGFIVTFNRVDDQANLFPITIDDSSEFLSAADLKIKATMKDGFLELVMEGVFDNGLSEKQELKELFDKSLFDVGFSVNLRYFSMQKGSDRPRPKGLQNYLDNNGGIRFIRNGFHVAPYGERFNDWLSLDDSSRRRLILPPHANTNFVGEVLVSDPDGTLFEETSAREGVIENDAFSLLVETTKNIALKVASHVAFIRKKKVTASQNYSPPKNKEEELRGKLDSLKEKLVESGLDESADPVAAPEESDIGRSENTEESKAKVPVSEILEDLESVNETLTEYIDEQLMYRVLSSTGLAISEFTHEIQTCLTNLSLNSEALSSLSKENDKIKGVSELFEENLSMLIAYTDFFDGTMRSNSNREKNHYDMRKLVKKFVEAMEPTVKRRGYVLNTHFDSFGIWTKKVHVSEVMSILINLFTNACKAIERAGQSKGALLIDVQTSDKFMTIRFEDNGDGIPTEKWGKVFAPLYTTSIPAKAYSSENDYNRGMGLGLSITENIVIEMNGEIAVVEPSEGFATCMKITLPLAEESELPEDAY